ncbi:MAG TPA: prephenate dehydratase [Acidimicrobiales bacterium]|nr:prephenate dehydratase [Acidimicrobiales bacterium]
MNDLAQPSPPSDAARPLRVGLLGPRGTFAEQALLTQPDLAGHERVRYATMADVLRATEDGEVDLGFVAIENSIEGTVNVTSDTLAFDVDLLIQREVVIPIQQHLMAPPGVTLADVEFVASIPVATAQCWKFLHEHLPTAVAQSYNATAEAAEAVSRSDQRNIAAIGNELAASIYGLDVIAREIEDHPENETRFVAVAREVLPASTGHDKTSIVVFQHEDAPGSLLAILQQFAARSINLTNLQSRPTKKGLGDYCFLIDLEGHVADDVVADCLKVLRTKGHEVKFLGSYPAAGDHGPAVREAQTDAVKAADAWLADIRGRIAPA